MVQVDIFWSYGLGSGLALAAHKKLKKEPKLWINEDFILAMAWIALLFGPSGIYLLWAFPWWETMFVAAKHSDIPPWLVTVFSITNITQGLLGYWLTYKFIRAGRMGTAKFQLAWSYFAFFFVLIVGWDGTGFRRFFYAGNGEEWRAGVMYTIGDFFHSPVYFTLLGMGVILVPSYIWLVKRAQQQANS